MNEEIWRDIVGYEGRYQVSNMGRIRSLPVKAKTGKYKGGILVLMKDGCGYSCVNLSRKMYKVHRLVAMAFIPNENNYPCVNHRDENKQNNAVDNLEWCSYKYNSNYGTRNKRISENTHKKRKITQYDLSGNFIKTWDSISEASKHYGVETTTICGCCAGRQHTSCGFVWRYANDEF